MRHIAIIDGPALTGRYSWFCQETPGGGCNGEGFDFDSEDEARSDAESKGHPAASEDDIPGRYDGIPGLVWYTEAEEVAGADLRLGDWLDSLDHRGARSIAGLWRGPATRQELGDADCYVPSATDDTITVMFFGGDTEQVRADVVYSVVNPGTEVAPDGSPA